MNYRKIRNYEISIVNSNGPPTKHDVGLVRKTCKNYFQKLRITLKNLNLTHSELHEHGLKTLIMNISRENTAQIGINRVKLGLFFGLGKKRMIFQISQLSLTLPDVT